MIFSFIIKFFVHSLFIKFFFSRGNYLLKTVDINMEKPLAVLRIRKNEI